MEWSVVSTRGFLPPSQGATLPGCTSNSTNERKSPLCLAIIYSRAMLAATHRGESTRRQGASSVRITDGSSTPLENACASHSSMSGIQARFHLGHHLDPFLFIFPGMFSSLSCLSVQNLCQNLCRMSNIVLTGKETSGLYQAAVINNKDRN